MTRAELEKKLEQVPGWAQIPRPAPSLNISKQIKSATLTLKDMAKSLNHEL